MTIHAARLNQDKKKPRPGATDRGREELQTEGYAMTSKALVHVDVNTLERLAFNSGQHIEPDPKLGVAFLTLGPTTFAAPLDVA